MSDSDQTTFECPECQSTSAGIIHSDPPRAKCCDCGHIYDIASFPPLSGPKPKRIAEPGKRHRRDDGPKALEVRPVAPPTPQQLGTGHVYTHEVLAGGPRALIAAQHEAARLSAKFGEEIETKWCLATPWLYKLASTDRARAHYALMWRPRFLAVVAMTRSILLGSRAARVSRPTIDAHRKADPDFDQQVIAAQEHAVDLLHDVTMREAIEGHAEPIYWQGIPCGHVIKVDNRLRIEMLRAHLPAKFQQPGRGSVNVNLPTGRTTIIIGEKERDELVALRQEALQEMFEKRAQAAEVTASNDAVEVGTVPALPVPPSA
jgi:hypothetical protein